MQTWDSIAAAMRQEGWSRRKVERLIREGRLEARREADSRRVRLAFFEYGADCMTEDEWNESVAQLKEMLDGNLRAVRGIIESVYG